MEQGFFFSYFPPLKPRCVLWYGVSYSPNNTVYILTFLASEIWFMTAIHSRDCGVVLPIPFYHKKLEEL